MNDLTYCKEFIPFILFIESTLDSDSTCDFALCVIIPGRFIVKVFCMHRVNHATNGNIFRSDFTHLNASKLFKFNCLSASNLLYIKQAYQIMKN